jgi:hypothetical protein
VQGHFQQQRRFDPNRGTGDVTVRIPRTNMMNIAAMRYFARCRDHLLAQMEGLEHYHEE